MRLRYITRAVAATLCACVTLLSGCSITPGVRSTAAPPQPTSAANDIVPFNDDLPWDESCGDAPLEIHYINVGQAGATFLKGPLGTTVMYDVGGYGDGPTIAKYLKDQGTAPADGIDYVIVSHRHTDHFGGYGGLLKAGYDVNLANIDSRSTTPVADSLAETSWWTKAIDTSARRPRRAQPGEVIDLGCGAQIVVAASNGYLVGGGRVVPIDENDRSISLLIRRGDFTMTLDGDLGSGSDACTGSETEQKGVQQRVMMALIEQGYVDADVGVDVMHVAHHGSESSTSSEYFNLAKPEVALISVGLDGGNYKYGHPRQRVVDSVLLGPERPSCVTAPPVLGCFQTEDGLAKRSVPVQRHTSNECVSSGNIVVKVDASGDYTVDGDNHVAEASDAEFGTEVLAFDADERAGLTPADDAGLMPAGKPFFDDLDNPIRMSDGTLRDISPRAPTLTALDRDLLALCGDFGAPQPDLAPRLHAVLAAHAASLAQIRERLLEGGVPMSSGEAFTDELVELWTAQSGFEHVFCGQRGSASRIGGLHFAGRYLQLQQQGHAWIAEGASDGVFESDGARVFSLPAYAHCGANLCYSPLKGYHLDWDAEDQFVEGTLAWYFGAVEDEAGACLHTAADGTSNVFAYLNGSIRTLYPDLTPAANLRRCQEDSVTPLSSSTFEVEHVHDDECGH